MGDRVRVGELLAAIGTIGLGLLLAFGAWFEFDSSKLGPDRNAAKEFPAMAEYAVTGAVGSSALGWFVQLIAAAAVVAGLVYLFRVLTSRTTERPLLQAPVAYALGALAVIVLALRLWLGDPEYTLSAAELGFDLQSMGEFTLPTDVALGGWLGLLSAFLIVVGTWIAMSDERTQSKGARARTATLLADMTVRPAPAVFAGSHPGTDAGASADDALPTDPPDGSPDPSSTRPSGGPA